VEKYSKNASRLSDWLATNIPEGLTVLAFPAFSRRLLRTTNGVERLHRDIRRRAHVISSQPGCLRLVSAILAEMSEEWLTGRTYINFEGAT
jgi:transposase-like protein